MLINDPIIDALNKLNRIMSYKYIDDVTRPREDMICFFKSWQTSRNWRDCSDVTLHNVKFLMYNKLIVSAPAASWIIGGTYVCRIGEYGYNPPPIFRAGHAAVLYRNINSSYCSFWVYPIFCYILRHNMKEHGLEKVLSSQVTLLKVCWQKNLCKCNVISAVEERARQRQSPSLL